MNTAGGYDLLPLGTASRACAHVAHIKINCDKASETSEEPQIASFLSVRGASENVRDASEEPISCQIIGIETCD